jgi:anti-anti-sigma factor
VLFEVERGTLHDQPVLRVNGDLDTLTTPELARTVTAELTRTPRSLVIDLSGTTFLDSSGARQLVLSSREAARGGTAVQLVCPRENTAVRLVIDLLELETIVPVVESTDVIEGPAT